MTKELEKSLAVLRRQKPYLQGAYHVKELGVFRSFARVDVMEESDIDVLVDFREDAKIGLIKIYRFGKLLERTAG